MDEINFSLAPDFIKHFPPKNGAYVSAPYIAFNISEDWEMNSSSINFQVDANDGRGYQYIIQDGEIQTNPRTQEVYKAKIWTLPSLIGAHVRGNKVVGRQRNRFRVEYLPDEKFPDYSSINVSMSCNDVFGNATQDQYSFTVLGYKPYKFPHFSFYNKDNYDLETSCLYFGNAFMNQEYQGQFVVFWGKDLSSNLDLLDCSFSIKGGNTTETGKQILDEGWISVKKSDNSTWVPIYSDTNYTLGPFAANESKGMDIKVTVPNNAGIAGLYSLSLDFDPIRQATLGYRPLGNCVRGGGSIRNMIKEQPVHRLDLTINVLSNEYDNYLSQFKVRY